MKLTSLLLLLFVLAFALPSCRSGHPKYVIGMDSMKVYMWDMMRADEYYLEIIAKDTSAAKRKENIRLYEQVFAIHKITKGKFDSSFRYYEAHPIAFKILIDSLDAYALREKSNMYNRQYGQGLPKTKSK